MNDGNSFNYFSVNPTLYLRDDIIKSVDNLNILSVNCKYVISILIIITNANVEQILWALMVCVSPVLILE